MVETAPDLVLVLSCDGRIELTNQRLPGIAGAVGTSALRVLDDENRAVMRDAMKRALESDEVVQYQVQGPDAHGGACWYSSRMRRFSLGPADPPRLLLFTTDVTEARQAARRLRETTQQLESFQRQAVQAQKMEAVGRLAGGIAHDFNNLLTSIISFTQFAQDDLAEADPGREDLDEVLKAADSAARLIGQLLSFSRRSPVAPVVLELNDSLANVSKLLRRTIGESVELVLVRSAKPAHVRLDPGQFEQLVFNLAVNARDAMHGSGTLTFEVEPGTCTACYRERECDTFESGCIELRVRDTGEGIAEEHLDRVFEPFFSTKDEQGTGLGLATCHGLVEQAGGRMAVESRPGKGTTFFVCLPLVDPRHDGPEDATGGEALPSMRSGTALVVEDQPTILKSMVRALQSVGMRVRKARTAEEALAGVDRDVSTLDLVVSDVVLPGLSGIALVERLRASRPGLRVVLTSGYLGDEHGSGVETDARTAFLPKPFSSGQLLSKVEQLRASSSDVPAPRSS